MQQMLEEERKLIEVNIMLRRDIRYEILYIYPYIVVHKLLNVTFYNKIIFIEPI